MQLINLRSIHNRHEYVIWNPVTFLLSSHLYDVKELSVLIKADMQAITRGDGVR